MSDIKNVSTLSYIDASVVGAPLAATKDLDDIAIDDDYSMLDEFLESANQMSGKVHQCVGPVFFYEVPFSCQL